MTIDYSTTETLDLNLYKAIEAQLEIRIPKMDFCVDYTAQQACSNEFWKLLKPGRQKLAGKYISQLVKEGLIDLYLVERLHEYPHIYRRK
jgi:hypothetical protein